MPHRLRRLLLHLRHHRVQLVHLCCHDLNVPLCGHQLVNLSLELKDALLAGLLDPIEHFLFPAHLFSLLSQLLFQMGQRLLGCLLFEQLLLGLFQVPFKLLDAVLQMPSKFIHG